jgi:hypothetical protein
LDKKEGSLTNKSQQRSKIRKDRIFKVLDYDPGLSLEAISQRFRIAYTTASEFRSEWKSLRGIS